jgi:hypothetical protein
MKIRVIFLNKKESLVEFLGKSPSYNDMNVNDLIVYPMWQYSWNEVLSTGKWQSMPMAQWLNELGSWIT